MGKDHVEAYLTHLAVDKNVSPTTQNQAFNAILFLYKEVLGIDTSEWNIQALRAKRKEHLPVVLTKEEVKEIIFQMNGVYRLMLELLYGCGLRMNELLRLRVKETGSFLFLRRSRRIYTFKLGMSKNSTIKI